MPAGTGGVSSAGRAPALQAGGHRFDPGTLHFFGNRTPSLSNSAHFRAPRAVGSIGPARTVLARRVTAAMIASPQQSLEVRRGRDESCVVRDTMDERDKRVALLEEQNRQLAHALESRLVIEQAKGIVAERIGLGVEEAYQLLRYAARSSHLGLRDLAAEVVADPRTPEAVVRALARRPSWRASLRRALSLSQRAQRELSEAADVLAAASPGSRRPTTAARPTAAVRPYGAPA